MNTASAVSRHHASKIVIALQSFVILSLTYWLVEEYLNNMYLRQYVSEVFQANGLVFGIVGMLLLFGSATGLFVKHRHGQSTVSLEIKTPEPIVGAAKKEEKKKLDSDFHPVVAALKADMADRRLSFGSMLGAGVEQPSTAPVPSVEVRKTSVLDQLTPNRQPPVTGPKPGQIVGPPTQRPPLAPPQSAVGSNVLQTSQPSPQQLPLKITTVITGIMPAQKKKDPALTPEEKPSSSH
jgi:hypothetical protein